MLRSVGRQSGESVEPVVCLQRGVCRTGQREVRRDGADRQRVPLRHERQRLHHAVRHRRRLGPTTSHAGQTKRVRTQPEGQLRARRRRPRYDTRWFISRVLHAVARAYFNVPTGTDVLGDLKSVLEGLVTRA